MSNADSPEEALELKARYEKLPEVSRVVEVATLVPPDQDHKLPLLADIQERLRSLPTRDKTIEHDPPDGRMLRGELTQLLGQLSQRPAGDGARPGAAGGLAAVAAGAARPSAAPDDAAGETATSQKLKVFEQRLAGDLAEDLHRLREVSTPEPISWPTCRPTLRERYVGPHGKWLLRVFAKDCLWDFGPLEHFTEQVQTVDPEATGKPFGTVEGLKAMKDGLQRAGLYAFLVIAAVLFSTSATCGTR